MARRLTQYHSLHDIFVIFRYARIVKLLFQDANAALQDAEPQRSEIEAAKRTVLLHSPNFREKILNHPNFTFGLHSSESNPPSVGRKGH